MTEKIQVEGTGPEPNAQIRRKREVVQLCAGLEREGNPAKHRQVRLGKSKTLMEVSLLSLSLSLPLPLPLLSSSLSLFMKFCVLCHVDPLWPTIYH